MAELYRHTDDLGETIAIRTDDDSRDIVVIHRRGVAFRSAVDIDEEAGRRLLAALQQHYGTEGKAADA